MKYDELTKLNEKDIDALYETMGGVQKSAAVPIFDGHGDQIYTGQKNFNSDARPRALSYHHVAAVNQWFAKEHDLNIDPSSTLSSALKNSAIFLGAVDVYGITFKDRQMVLGIRSAFQNAASVAPRKVFDLASGFRSLKKGTSEASPAFETAKSELFEEVGVSAYWGQFESVHSLPNFDRLIHFPQVPTNSGTSFTGLRPTFSNSYVVWLPWNVDDIPRSIILSNEHDGVLTAPVKDVLALWSGETDKIKAVIYPSSRLNGVKNGQNLDEIFANAKLNPVIGDKECVTLGKPIHAHYRSIDAMINGSMASIATKAKLLREFGL